MPWLIFAALVLGMLSVDLLVHRHSQEVRLKEAFLWSGVWIGLGLAFALLVNFWMGPQKALEYLTGYVIEESLSVDNLFVFLMIFSYFRTPRHLQHRVLFWGILGAWVMRGFFIFAGVALIHKFHWILYFFGGLLVLTGLRIAFEKGQEVRPERNPVLKVLRLFLPLTGDYQGSKFFVKRAGGGIAGTLLFVVLLAVESADVVFAVDSIPAVLAVSHDPFIVYTSNVFAILGLRSLFFALSGIMDLFCHLHYGLAFILVFVGVKMIIADFYKVPIGAALGVVAATLLVSILASLIWPKRHPAI